MDTEQARDSARALNDLAGRLTADATRVKDEAGAVPWEGADAEAFRARVSSIVAPGMHEAVKQLFALAHALQSNALEQDAASNASDASSGGAGSSSALGLAEATRTQALGITALAGLTEGMRSLFGRGSRRVRAMGGPIPTRSTTRSAKSRSRPSTMPARSVGSIFTTLTSRSPQRLSQANSSASPPTRIRTHRAHSRTCSTSPRRRDTH